MIPPAPFPTSPSVGVGWWVGVARREEAQALAPQVVPGGWWRIRHVASGAGPATAAGGIDRVPVGIGLLGSRLRDVVVGLAERTACSSTSEPWVHTDGVERMAAGETADVIVILEGINTDGAGIATGANTFGRKCRIDMFVIFIVARVVAGVVGARCAGRVSGGTLSGSRWRSSFGVLNFLR